MWKNRRRSGGSQNWSSPAKPSCCVGREIWCGDSSDAAQRWRHWIHPQSIGEGSETTQRRCQRKEHGSATVEPATEPVGDSEWYAAETVRGQFRAPLHTVQAVIPWVVDITGPSLVPRPSPPPRGPGDEAILDHSWRVKVETSTCWWSGDYFNKWMEAFPTADQEATTVAASWWMRFIAASLHQSSFTRIRDVS